MNNNQAPSWNYSTHTGDKVFHRRTRENGEFEGKQFYYNFRAEVLPAKVSVPKTKLHKSKVPDKDFHQRPHPTERVGAPKREMPNHPELEGKPKFDLSYGVDRELNRRKFNEKEKQRERNSMASNKLVSSQRLTLVERYRIEADKEREAKRERRKEKAKGTLTMDAWRT